VWLARRRTSATLRELAPAFGLSHPDSVSNLIRRVDRALTNSCQVRHDIEPIERSLESPIKQNRACPREASLHSELDPARGWVRDGHSSAHGPRDGQDDGALFRSTR
jgi:hypothetical protein